MWMDNFPISHRNKRVNVLGSKNSFTSAIVRVEEVPAIKGKKSKTKHLAPVEKI